MPELPTITRLNNIGGLGAGFTSPTIPDATLDLLLEESGYLNSAGYANQDSVGSSNFKLATLSGPNPIFSRATAATFRGSDGLIQYAPENLIAQSENFTGNNWTVANTTVASSASISPTGSSSFVVAEIAATGPHTFGNMGGTIINSLAVTSGTVYTGSFFLKKNSTVDWIQINFGSTGFGAAQYANFNLSTGVIGNYAGLAGSPKIENCGNGWYRCSISVAATATTTTNTAFIAFTNNLDQAARSPSYAGSTSNSVLATMAQLERSSTARPYISTTTTARYGPRFEYDLSGNPLGLLMEEQSQNLLSYSEQFNDASWLDAQLRWTASPNTVSSPNGLVVADTITADGNTNPPLIAKQVSLSASTYSFSCFVKKNNVDFVRLVAATDTSYANGAGKWFNVSNGTELSSVTFGSGVSLISSNSTSVGNGWYRISIVCSLSSPQSGAAIAISFANTENGTVVTGNAVYLWGAQLEQKPFATSYIPTVGASATRSADVCLIDGANFRRTNLLTYSEEFDNPAWSKENGATISANSIAAPNSSLTADKLVEGTVINRPRLRTMNVTVNNGVDYTYSFYAKPSGRSILDISLLNNTTSVLVDISTGERISGSTNVSLTNVGDGWYRVSVWGTFTQATGNYRSDIWVANSASNVSYQGDGTSGIYIWGAQLEVSSTFYENPSPYIPTTSSAVTVYDRFYNDTEGAILIQGDRNNVVTSGTPDFVNIGDGTTNEYMAITRATGTDEKYVVIDGASPQVNLTVSPAVSANTSFAIAAAYKLNDFSATENGDVPVTDTAGTLPTADRMEIGGRSGRELNGHIKKLRYYNKRVSDINLKYLSSNFTQ